MTSNGEVEGPHRSVGRATRAHNLFQRPRSQTDHAVRESFFYGREFLNDADLNQQALSWCTRKANLRLHRTTCNNRRLQAAMRSSRLLAVKTLETFDFSFQPSIKREQIESLHGLGFIDRKENVVLLGPPGVGKTHLALSLAIAPAQRGRRVYYGTLIDLITSREEAQAAIPRKTAT
jgi:DNA replication protein DnaC